MGHDIDKGIGRFGAHVARQDHLAERLPLVHSTDAFALRTILEDGTVRPQPCNVFQGEALTYSIQPTCSSVSATSILNLRSDGLAVHAKPCLTDRAPTGQ